MNKLQVLRGTALSAGVAAGLLGLVAFAPSAFAQYNADHSYWNGAPRSPGPSEGSGYYYNGPAYGGWYPGYGSTVAPQPYWQDAPRSIGPGA